MQEKLIRFDLRIMIALGGLFVFSGTALAEDAAPKPATAADVACLQTPAKLNDGDIQSFIANPNALLGAANDTQLTDRVRDLAGSSKLAFDKIAVLTKTASDSQKPLIAAGLARAVYSCTNAATEATQIYADSIQAFVAGMGDPAFASTFQQALQQVNVASIGPGAAGVGGGSTDDSGSKISGDNKYSSKGDGSKATTTGSYTFGSVNPFSAAARNPSPT